MFWRWHRQEKILKLLIHMDSKKSPRCGPVEIFDFGNGAHARLPRKTSHLRRR
nr:MAG TPA: hypothetical protein [Caudoviricetes sp.]